MWQEVRALFDLALERSATDREALLAAAPAAVATEVRRLLVAHDDASRFLEEGAVAASAAPSLEGRLIGPYRLGALIGEGGMGSVYRAERIDGAFELDVAIKILSAVGPTVVERFQRERQTLARLDHPHIARLLDGGSTGEGLAYLVMEHVDGLPIDRYCERHALGTADRLALFRQMAEAVSHAHRHLVVHRDLKPSNVLVTRSAAEDELPGTVKLLDFGIARLLPGPADADGERLTLTHQLLLTPAYASPEQARGEEVTTASDVFSLGLLLYELLVGRLPPERASGSRWEEPGEVHRRPSDVAADPMRRRALRGDLDSIILQALRARPEERYASVGHLLDDLDRSTTGQPVAARGDDLGYRVRRFLRRHHRAVLTATGFLALLLAGLAATLWQANEARSARHRAERRYEELRRLAGERLFALHDEIAHLAGSTAARRLVLEEALRYLDRLAAEAEGDRNLELDLADAYVRLGDLRGNPAIPNLGDTDGARVAYERALDLRQRALDPADPAGRRALADVHHRLGVVQWWSGTTDVARLSQRIALGMRRDLAAESGRDEDRLRLAESLGALGALEAWNGAYPDGLRRYDEALEVLASVAAPGPAIRLERATVLTRRGEALAWLLRYDEAISSFATAEGLLEALLAEKPHDPAVQRALWMCQWRFASTQADLDPAAALVTAERARAMAARHAQLDPVDVRPRQGLALSYSQIGELLSATGDLEGAEQALRRAIEVQGELAVEDPANTAPQVNLGNSYIRLSRVLVEQEALAPALEALRTARQIREELLRADPDDDSVRRDLAVARTELGEVHDTMAHRPGRPTTRVEQLEEARGWYRSALELWRDLEARGRLRESDRSIPEQIEARLEELGAAGR